MKWRTPTTAVFVALLFTGCGRHVREEYRVQDIADMATKDLETGLNKAAEDGWTVKAVQGRRMIFAREK